MQENGSKKKNVAILISYKIKIEWTLIKYGRGNDTTYPLKERSTKTAFLNLAFIHQTEG